MIHAAQFWRIARLALVLSLLFGWSMTALAGTDALRTPIALLASNWGTGAAALIVLGGRAERAAWVASRSSHVMFFGGLALNTVVLPLYALLMIASLV